VSDDETRLLRTENLINRGYRMTVALHITDAISRARVDPLVDLILVNQHQVSANEAIGMSSTALGVIESSQPSKSANMLLSLARRHRINNRH
jgi:hypothetical protein